MDLSGNNKDPRIRTTFLILIYKVLAMYGLILNNFVSYLQHKYGEEAWDNIRRLANIDTPTFSVHQVIFQSFSPLKINIKYDHLLGLPRAITSTGRQEVFQSIGLQWCRIFRRNGILFCRVCRSIWLWRCFGSIGSPTNWFPQWTRQLARVSKIFLSKVRPKIRNNIIISLIYILWKTYTRQI